MSTFLTGFGFVTINCLMDSCYKSEKTILALWTLRESIPGLQIQGIWFSESGAGKSRCDAVSSSALSREHIVLCTTFISVCSNHQKMGP